MYGTKDSYNVRSHEREQRIIPGIKFTCNGTLTKWIIGAQRTLTQATNPQNLQLQIWRRQGSSNTYDRTTFSDITALNATDDLNVYEYIPNPPLEFQPNDILGLYQPHRNNTQVVVHYQSRGGPRNFVHFHQDSPVTSQFTTEEGVYYGLPLVTVEVNGKLNLLPQEITSVMIHHRGASLSEQHTDLPIGHCTKQNLCRTSSSYCQCGYICLYTKVMT